MSSKTPPTEDTIDQTYEDLLCRIEATRNIARATQFREGLLIAGTLTLLLTVLENREYMNEFIDILLKFSLGKSNAVFIRKGGD